MGKTELRERTYHNMTLHPPVDEVVARLMDGVRELFRATASAVIDAVPESRELSMALTSLEDALMYAIAGIARNQE